MRLIFLFRNDVLGSKPCNCLKREHDALIQWEDSMELQRCIVKIMIGCICYAKYAISRLSLPPYSQFALLSLVAYYMHVVCMNHDGPMFKSMSR